MTHRVVMVRPSLNAVPNDVYEEARHRFEEIAEGLEGIPQESPFWASVRISRLCLDVRGWTFFYALDAGILRVTDARPA